MSRFAGFVVAVLLCVLAMPDASAQFRRRVACDSSYCPPSHAAVEVIETDVVEVIDVEDLVDLSAFQASPIVVQNNFNGQPINLGQTLYGYAADPLQNPLTAPQRYNPYQVDPAGMLRESVRMTDRTAELMRQSIEAYQSLGTLALTTGSQADTIRAQTEQLRAQAALIQATTPAAITTPIVAPLAAPQTQRLTSGSQTICIDPDGRGGFTIRVEGSGEQSEPLSSTIETGQHVGPQSGHVQQGVEVLQTRCASCHTGEQAKGKFVIFDDSGVMVDVSDLERIIEVTRAGSMPPPPAAPLTEQELAKLILLAE